jgi:hypothetical protein
MISFGISSPLSLSVSPRPSLAALSLYLLGILAGGAARVECRSTLYSSGRTLHRRIRIGSCKKLLHGGPADSVSQCITAMYYSARLQFSRALCALVGMHLPASARECQASRVRLDASTGMPGQILALLS